MFGIVPLKQPDYLNDEEIRRVLEASGERIRTAKSPCRRFQYQRIDALIHTLLFTGARISEALSISWASIRWDELIIVVPTLKRRKRPLRSIPVPRLLMDVLSDYRKEAELHYMRHHTPTIFPVKGPTDVKRVRRSTDARQCRVDRGPFQISRHTAFAHIRKVMELAGIHPSKRHPHIFRHTYATRASSNGMPPLMLASILGHANMKNTMIYYHLNARDAQKYVEDLVIIDGHL